MRILWRRLLTNPTTRVLSRDGDVTLIQVEGLVCDKVCAVRTRQGLERIEGVRHVSVDLDSGVATVVGAPASAEAYEHAVTSMVAGRGIRRIIERIARARRPRHAKTPS
ncbi:MAG: heavy metal-associated domain-containing protein [Dehalococcoidia bacterium]